MLSVGLGMAAVCVLAAVAPATASAATFCVTSGCPSPSGTLAQALNAASATNEPDVVTLPAGSVPAGDFAQVGSDSVHSVAIVGAGPGSTTVTPGNGPTLGLLDQDSSVSDLTLQVGTNGTALTLEAGSVEDVNIMALPGAPGATGISIGSLPVFAASAPTIRRTSIQLPITSGSFSTGILNSADRLVTVEDSEITAVTGFSGSGVIRRTKVIAQTGARVSSTLSFIPIVQSVPGSLLVENSAFSLRSVNGPPVGLEASSGAAAFTGVPTATLTARRVTLAGTGTGIGVAARASSLSGTPLPATASAVIDDSVVTGFADSVERFGVPRNPIDAVSVDAPAFVTVSHSAVDLSTANDIGPGTLTHGPGNIAADPRLRDVSAGDLRLRGDSPAIDAAGPAGAAPGETDLAGNPRVFGARADMGAFEYRGRVLAALAGSPNPAQVGEPVTFDASGSQTGESAGTYSFDLDGDGSFETDRGTSPTATRSFPAAGTFPVAVRVTSADGATSIKAVDQSVVPPAAQTSVVVVEALEITNEVFRIGARATAVSARKSHPRGTTFRYELSGDASVTIAIAQQQRGRRVGGKCAKPTAKNRKRRSCKRFVGRGILTRFGTEGANTLPFSGRIGRKALRPGRYRATITATDREGKSAPRSVAFRIVKG